MTHDRTAEIADRLGVHPRWLPETPHAERILEQVEAGSCHLEHRGHRQPPFLVFNDGGAMELPTVRWMKTSRGTRLASVSEHHDENRTTHYDVCGTVDTILDIVKTGGDPSQLGPLYDDIEAMIRRMSSRRDEYDSFLSEIGELLARELPEVRRKPVEPAFSWLAQLRESAGGEGERTIELAEAVRDVAQYLEYSLTDMRRIAVRVEALYREIKGLRNWSVEESRAEDDRS